MELQLKNGDYVADGIGNLRRSEGEQALLQRVLYKLTARRGSFPFLPKLGSRLYLLGQEKDKQSAAETAIAEALSEEENLRIEGVYLTQAGEGKCRVQVDLSVHDTALSLALEI